MSAYPNRLRALEAQGGAPRYPNVLPPADVPTEVGEYTPYAGKSRMSVEAELLSRLLGPAQSSPGEAQPQTEPDPRVTQLLADVGRGLGEYFTEEKRTDFFKSDAARRHGYFRSLPREVQTGIFDLVDRFGLRNDPMRALALVESLRAATPGVTAALERKRAEMLAHLSEGTTEQAAEFVGGPFLGPVTVATGLTRPFSDNSPRSMTRKLAQGGAEVLSGALQTVAPFLGVTQPGFLPALPAFELAGAATQAATSRLPLEPEYKQLIDTVIPLVVGARALRATEGKAAARAEPRSELPVVPDGTRPPVDTRAMETPRPAEATERPTEATAKPVNIQHARVAQKVRDMAERGEIVKLNEKTIQQFTPQELRGIFEDARYAENIRGLARTEYDRQVPAVIPFEPHGSRPRVEESLRVERAAEMRPTESDSLPPDVPVRETAQSRSATIGELAEGTRVELDGRAGVVRAVRGGKVGFSPAGRDLIRYVEPEQIVRVAQAESAPARVPGPLREEAPLSSAESQAPAPIAAEKKGLLERADRVVSETVTKPLVGRLEKAFESLPGGKGFFANFPNVRKLFEDLRLEEPAIRNLGDDVAKLFERQKPSAEERKQIDFILHENAGPAEAAKLRPELRELLPKAREAAQKVTAARKALNLSVREKWLEGEAAWYPNFFKPKMGHMIGGRFFGRSPAKPGEASLGTLKQRLSDRFWFMDGSGKPVEISEGRVAAFETRVEAKAWSSEQGGKKWKLVEPMTYEQKVGIGLITDPSLNLRLGYSQQASLIARSRFLARIGELAEVSSAPRDGYVSLGQAGFDIPKVLADRNPAIAKLRDGYVPEALAKDLAALYGRSGAFARVYRAAEGSLRKWATVRNPPRFVRQIAENELLLALTDSGASLNKPAQLKAFRDYARGAAGEQGVPFWGEFRSSRLGVSDLVTGEYKAMWNAVAREVRGHAALSLTERLTLWAESNRAARALLKADEFAHKLYAAEDSAYKYYRFRRLREQGVDREAAVQRVADTSFDYFDVPPLVRNINRVIPFAPTVAYQFSRIFGNMLRQEPATMMLRLGLLADAYGFIRDQMMERSGLQDEDIEKMDKALRPHWYEIVLPATDEKGRYVTVNLKWLIPYADVALVMQPMEEEAPAQGLAELVRRGLPMVAQPAATAISQKTAFGRDVLTGAESRKDAVKKLAYAATVESLPALLGSYWAALERNERAGERSKSAWRKRHSLLL